MKIRKIFTLMTVQVLFWILLGSVSIADEVSYDMNIGKLRAQITFGMSVMSRNPDGVDDETEASLISGVEALELLDMAGYGEPENTIVDFPVIRRVLQIEGAIAVHLPTVEFERRPGDSAGLIYVPSPSEVSFETSSVFACNGVFLHLSRSSVLNSDCKNRLCEGAYNRSNPRDKCNGCICTFDGCLPPLDCAHCSSGLSGPSSLLEKILELCDAKASCNPERFLDSELIEGPLPRPL